MKRDLLYKETIYQFYSPFFGRGSKLHISGSHGVPLSERAPNYKHISGSHGVLLSEGAPNYEHISGSHGVPLSKRDPNYKHISGSHGVPLRKEIQITNIYPVRTVFLYRRRSKLQTYIRFARCSSIGRRSKLQTYIRFARCSSIERRSKLQSYIRSARCSSIERRSKYKHISGPHGVPLSKGDPNYKHISGSHGVPLSKGDPNYKHISGSHGVPLSEGDPNYKHISGSHGVPLSKGDPNTNIYPVRTVFLYRKEIQIQTYIRPARCSSIERRSKYKHISGPHGVPLSHQSNITIKHTNSQSASKPRTQANHKQDNDRHTPHTLLIKCYPQKHVTL